MIYIHPERLTVYSDEIHDDPAQALALATNKYGLKTVCLRRAWTSSVATLNDVAANQLKSLLRGLKPLLISSDLGLDISTVGDPEFERPFLMANYFGAKYLRVHVGGRHQATLRPGWIRAVGDRAVKAGITPLFEYNPEYGNMTATEIHEMLSIHPRWKVLYDPTQFVVRKNVNPFTSYWPTLYDKVAVIDLRDYKIGEGFKPVGMGDCSVLETVRDANVRGYTGSFAVEPGLGRKFGSTLGREAVFQLAYQQINNHL